MDRFYGQHMSQQQIDRIRMYYVATLPCDVPLWANALFLLVLNQECHCGRAYSWDFGLVRDYDDLMEARYDPWTCPFHVWHGLWDRLSRRRSLLENYRHPPHELGVNWTYQRVRSGPMHRDDAEDDPDEHDLLITMAPICIRAPVSIADAADAVSMPLPDMDAELTPMAPVMLRSESSDWASAMD